MKITRKTTCEFVISNFARNELGMKGVIDVSTVPQDSVKLSSTLAVAMEYLGLLTNPEYASYAARRSGIVYIPIVDSNEQLVTFREFLDSLAE